MKILITGSSGLIGSEVCMFFKKLLNSWSGQLKKFLGRKETLLGDLRSFKTQFRGFTHHELDIRDRTKVLDLIKEVKPDAVVHAAAQPSHDKAASIPFDDFDVNAVGTMNLLEAVRQFCKTLLRAYVYKQGLW